MGGQLIREEWIKTIPPRQVCDHGSRSSQHPSAKPVHSWTRVYWPAALAFAVIAFYVPYFEHYHWPDWGLLAGAAALLIPETACFLTGNAQDTLSDWWWNTWHITGTQPPDKWTAEHYFAVLVWAWISITVTVHLWGEHWQAGLASAGFLVVWLGCHFGGRWWR